MIADCNIFVVILSQYVHVHVGHDEMYALILYGKEYNYVNNSGNEGTDVRKYGYQLFKHDARLFQTLIKHNLILGIRYRFSTAF